MSIFVAMVGRERALWTCGNREAFAQAFIVHRPIGDVQEPRTDPTVGDQLGACSKLQNCTSELEAIY